MYNVIISFGNYPTIIRDGANRPGPYTSEELGLMWIKHVAQLSAPNMLKKYRLVLLLPRDITIPESCNLDLEQWGENKRFDENNKTQQWPLGPNMVFQQVLWLYHYKKLQGPFLWCEPDCVPIRPTWLDDLFSEYERSKKPFMGAFVESSTVDGVRTAKHMSGNAIYPDNPHLLAPTLMEARVVPWDCYAANQIVNQCHFTDLIQHDRGVEVPRANAKTVLYHPDKIGAFINHFSGHPMPEPVKSEPVEKKQPGKPLIEVFGEERIDDHLDAILNACKDDRDTQRKVAYFMIEKGIVSQGYWATAMRRKSQAKKKATRKEPAAVHAEPAA